MTWKHEGPSPTVDVIIELEGGRIVLVKRKFEPHGWALPGGFVDVGETAAAAARREAKEETGLDVELTELFHVYADPKRDPRRHTLGVIYLGRASGTPAGADDAEIAQPFATNALPSPIVFDHGLIISDYLRYRADGRRPPVDR